MVESWPNHAEVKGLSPVCTARTGKDKRTKIKQKINYSMSSVFVNYPYCVNYIPSLILNGIGGLLKVSLIKEGANGKVSQFIMPLKSVYIKNVCFSEQKRIFIIFIL
jgi:hypothetical protein